MAETTTEKKPTVQETFQARSDQNQANIRSTYDSGIEAQKKSLLDAYNANTAAQQNAGQTIRQNYGTLNNDLTVQNNRNERNINQFADVRDVNRQRGSQAALNLGNARANADATLAFRQEQALAENQRQQDLAKVQYQAQVQSALADKDYKQAAALLDDYNNQNKWRDEQAQILATYGNFDPYKQLYGEEAANGMRNVWLRQNPDTAWQLGAMDPYTYRSITGRFPPGFNPGYGGGGGWYGPVVDKDGKQTMSLFGVNNASAGANLGGRGPSGHSNSTHVGSSSGGRSGKF